MKMSENKVKLDPSRSRFVKKSEEKKQIEANFNEQVSEHQEQQSALVKKTAELTLQFNQFIKDSTLKENKGPIQLEMEKQICKDIVTLSLELNQDQTQAEGIGSAGVNLLLLKIVMYQRDKINELGYKLSKLEKPSSPAKNDE
jgi:hypothetical protein